MGRRRRVARPRTGLRLLAAGGGEALALGVFFLFFFLFFLSQKTQPIDAAGPFPFAADSRWRQWVSLDGTNSLPSASAFLEDEAPAPHGVRAVWAEEVDSDLSDSNFSSPFAAEALSPKSPFRKDSLDAPHSSAAAALVYAELRHRVEDLFSPNGGADEETAEKKRLLRAALDKEFVSADVLGRGGGAFLQEQRAEASLPEREALPVSPAPTVGSLEREERKASRASSVRRFLVTSPYQAFGGGASLVPFPVASLWLQQAAALRSGVSLRAFLRSRGQRRSFPGVRSARQSAETTTTGGAKRKASRTTEEAIQRAITSSMQFHDGGARRRRGRRYEAKERRGYVLADSCVAVDYRAVVEELVAADALSASAPSAEARSRFDSATRACVCPSGWEACDRQAAAAAPYGWRATLERACEQQQQQQEASSGDASSEANSSADLNIEAFTRDLYAFNCKSKTPSLKRGDPVQECATAAFVLCKEKEPKCGLSEW